MDIEEYCNSLPKVELHSHVTGAIPDRILRELIKENYPDEDPEKIFLTCKFGTKESRELKSGFKMFEVLHSISNSLENVEKIIIGILEDYFNENCVLLELRTGPRETETFSKEDYVRKILETIKSFCSEEKKKERFFCGLLLSINRSKSLEDAERTLEIFEKLKTEYPTTLLGFDFSGNYRDKNFVFFKPVFDKIKKRGYKVAAHFAEIRNNQNSLDILEYHPDRLGHGLFIDEESISDIMFRKVIPVELCISGNTVSGKVVSVEHHPFYHFYLRYGYPFSINTDDRGIFSLTLSGEYIQIGKVFHVDQREMYQICWRSVKQSFFNTEVKNKVYEIMKEFETTVVDKVTHLIIPQPPPPPPEEKEEDDNNNSNEVEVEGEGEEQKRIDDDKEDERKEILALLEKLGADPTGEEIKKNGEECMPQEDQENKN